MSVKPDSMEEAIVLGFAIGILVSSLAIAVSIQLYYRRRGMNIGLNRYKLSIACGVGNLITFALAGFILYSIGGLPPGPYFGPRIVIPIAIYAIPLITGAGIVGVAVYWLSADRKQNVVDVPSSIIFTLGHLIVIPSSWSLAILIEPIL